MTTLQITLGATVLVCGLLAGFVFAFAVVVMPGLALLDDRAFIRAFQVIDGVIQRAQPLFVLMWLGSIVGVVASVVLALRTPTGAPPLLLVAAAAFLLGVHLPTFVVNVPLNNRLQGVETSSVDAGALSAARGAFERRWNRWNGFRTVVAVTCTALFVVTLVQLR